MKSAAVLVICLLLIQSCSDIFEFSPFDANVSSEGINSKKIEKILSTPFRSDTLAFALFSDTHENYDLTAKALEKINGMQGISFVICNGDVTNEAYAQEFMWYADVIEESAIPVVTVIGNHDCLANGELIFERLFGPVNDSFTYGGYKFIMFNNVIWENSNISPAYIWLREELKGNSGRNLVISHVPPLAKDIGDLHRIIYNQIVDSTNTVFAIHSSAHHYSEYYENGIHHMITGSIDKREFFVIKLFEDEVKIERIKF